LTKKKEKEKPEISFEKRVVPVEYEARGIFLGDLLNPDFVSKLKKEIGDFDVVNLMIFGGEDMIGLWHKSSEDMKKKILTITCKDPKTMEKLSKALGIKKEL
jgi:hypothetical protein